MKNPTCRFLHRLALLAAASLAFSAQAQTFRILVDLNTLRGSEASILQSTANAETSQLAADGVWMATPVNSNLGGWPDTFSSPSVWQSVITNLNGNNWTVAEDEYNWLGDSRWTTSAIYSLRSWSRPISQAMVNSDEGAPPDAPILTDSQINNAYNASFPSQVVVNARRYDGSNQTAVDAALTNPHCGGVSFELAVSDVGTNDYPYLNIPAGITNCLAAGKPCYIILVAKGDLYPSARCQNFTTAVANFMGWLNAQGISPALHNSSFFIVLASYDGPTKPTGFLNGFEGDYYQNSIRSAMTWVKAFRMWGSY